MLGRKYFFIKSVLNPDNVMDVKNASRDPGTRVVTYNQKKNDADNQLWWEDGNTGTIRNKLTDFCLDIDDEGKLCVNPYTGTPLQMWLLVDQTIQNTDAPNLCLDIEGNNTGEYAEICSYDFHGGDNQKWEYDYWSPEGGLFFIKSELNGLVLDVSGNSTSEGTEVVTWDQKTDESDKDDWANQVWWEEQDTQTIRSCLTGYCLDMSEEDRLVVNQYDPNNPAQKWTVQGSTIINPLTSQVLDIKGADADPDAKIVAYDYNGQSNQHWVLDYVGFA